MKSIWHMGEKSVGEKSLGENRVRWDAGFRSPFSGFIIYACFCAPPNSVYS